MPAYTNFGQISQLPKLMEVSPYNSARESDGLLSIWKFVNNCVITINKLINNSNQMAKDINGLELQNNMDLKMYPFKIYSLPDIYYAIGGVTNFNTNWRTVRVRSGFVLTTVVSSGSFVTGTDGWNQIPNQNTMPSYSSSIDIVLPANVSQYWFWISNTSGSYSLSYGANPQMADSGSSWASFPSASSNYIPIGYVDTNSSSSKRIAFVRQFLNADVVAQGSVGNNPGVSIYDSTGGTTYTGGNFVAVLTPSVLNGVNIVPGFYSLPTGQTTSANPPPASDIPQIPYISGSTKWLVICPGMVAASTCASGTTTPIYISSTGLV